MANGPSPRGRGGAGGPRPGGSADRGGAGPAPWLDEADYVDESPIHTLVGRRTFLALLLIALLLAVAIVAGVVLVSHRETTPIDVPAVGQPVPVLKSDGPWKVPASGPDAEGIPVEGQGQILYGTGAGQPTDARIALDALPEEPLPKPGSATDEQAAAATPATPAPVPPASQTAATPPATARPPAAAPARPAAPAPAPTPAPAGHLPKVTQALQAIDSAGGSTSAGGSAVQLGAFSSEGRAREAFRQLAGRFSYLAGLSPLIVPVTSDGRTLYRLRAATGSAATAADVCSRLKVAGEACSVVH